MDKKLHIAIRSYKRAGNVKTLDLFKNGYIWIPESQLDDYLVYYDRKQIITIPDEEDGNCPKKNNAILNRCKEDWVLILDDDITDICYYEKSVLNKVSPDEIEEIIIHYFKLAEELGVRFWGFNQNSDPLSYKVYNPICFLSPILGPFGGHLKTELRYDTETGTKEDYDFWLQNIKKYKKTLRINKYCYKHYHGSGLDGGLLGIRSMDYETKSYERLRKKWGSDVVKGFGGSGGGKKKTNILNTNVKIPIAGV